MTETAKMRPRPSQAMCTFVPNPSRELPSAWSIGSSIRADLRPSSRATPRAPFGGAGGRPAGSDNRPIDALQVAIDLAAVVQFLEQRGSDPNPGAALTPAIEAAEDRR